MKRVVIAAPRGFCAGVERAIAAVEQALEVYGPPVYVRKHVVHNRHVVADLERRGAVFVDSELAVPAGARLVLAAHGVPPDVYSSAADRGLTTIDATCPLVGKVHAEVRGHAAAGRAIVLIGHAGHDEVVGTTGQAPDSITLVESVDDAGSIDLDTRSGVAYVTQTTLSVDETAGIVRVLRQRFPEIVGPAKDDICYATTNRQRAVKRMLGMIDVLLVVGSVESSNSNRLVETARNGGVPAFLIEDDNDLDARVLDPYDTVGITSGASTPDRLVDAACEWFRALGITDIATLDPDVVEDVSFRPPPVRSPRSDDAKAALRAG